MAYRFILFACLQALCLQHVLSQAINFPKPCGCQQIVNQPCQQLLAQQSFVQPCQQVCQQVCQPVCQSVSQTVCQGYPAVNVAPCDVDYVASYVPSTTIIQDDTIANELANTLQLLIVSNLLGNTLPNNDLYALGAIGQPALLGQPGLLGQPLASLAVPALVGCGCGCGGCGCGCGGCGCGCGGCGYIL